LKYQGNQYFPWTKSTSRWRAIIEYDIKQHGLEYFADTEEAAWTYLSTDAKTIFARGPGETAGSFPITPSTSGQTSNAFQVPGLAVQLDQDSHISHKRAQLAMLKKETDALKAVIAANFGAEKAAHILHECCG
jgi:hypothetical protein